MSGFQVKLVGKGARGGCWECGAEIELTREHSCGGDRGAAFGCGRYLCTEHLSGKVIMPRRGEAGIPMAPREFWVCEQCFSKIDGVPDTPVDEEDVQEKRLPEKPDVRKELIARMEKQNEWEGW